MDEDAALMVKVGQGDQSAFTVLVERYRLRAVNFSYRFLADYQAAEDVAQDAFVRVYQSRHRYRPRASFSTWFFRILTNLCLNEVRRRKRRARAVLSKPLTALSSTEPASSEHQYQQQELALAVRRALAELPDRQRVALILLRFEGMDYEEIGRVMGVSRGAVDGLLSRAKESLRQKLASDFPDVTAENRGQRGLRN